jgi:hypothetical protein
MTKYDLVMPVDGLTYYLRELIERLTLEDSLDEVAYRATVDLKTTADLNLDLGQAVTVDAIPFGAVDQSMVNLLAPGVVWSIEQSNRIAEHLLITIYDRLIYQVKSEDEYLFPAGRTATQRLKQIAADWQIPLGAIADTKVPLAAAAYRGQTLATMLMDGLAETVSKGGEMFRMRMTAAGLTLVQVGANETVWSMETVEDATENESLDNVITQVKVLGNAPEGTKSPVRAIIKEDTEKYGTIQAIWNDPKATSAKVANAEAAKVLQGPKKTYYLSTIDINTLRAGDKIIYNGLEMIVISVRHECGDPGRMTLQAGSAEQVKRQFYLER